VDLDRTPDRAGIHRSASVVRVPSFPRSSPAARPAQPSSDRSWDAAEPLAHTKTTSLPIEAPSEPCCATPSGHVRTVEILT
jgi:hypothetical protein